MFDSRPFATYDVWPSKVVSGRSYTHTAPNGGGRIYSATFTVTFTAYEPFGVLDKKYLTGTDTENMGAYCGVLPQAQMPAVPTTASRQFLVYNCGTEVADTMITLAGTAPNGMTITNRTNGNVCTLVSLPVTGTLTVDSRRGLVLHNDAVAFNFHDDGYIRLEPYYPDITGIQAAWTSGSNQLTVSNMTPTAEWVGRYVLLGTEWVKIIYVSNQGVVTLQKNMGASGSGVTRLAVLNDIVIEGAGLSLTSFTFDYQPLLGV